MKNGQDITYHIFFRNRLSFGNERDLNASDTINIASISTIKDAYYLVSPNRIHGNSAIINSD
jgi:hypothetical protein